MAMTSLYYGLRCQEVINLKRSDLIKAGKYPALSEKTLKGGPERIIPIDNATLNEIKSIRPLSLEYLITFKGKSYYRKTIYKIIRRALDKAGFKDIAPKDASRHSRASQMAMQGASAREIQDQLGHSDIRTSQIYTHIKRNGKWIREDNQQNKLSHIKTDM
jgi:integrase/recombinase XerD